VRRWEKTRNPGVNLCHDFFPTYENGHWGPFLNNEMGIVHGSTARLGSGADP